MKLSRRFAFLPLFVLLCGSSFVAGQEPSLKDARQQRGIVEQPRTFANTILFQKVDGHVVRSDRFTGEGGLFGDFDGDDDIDLHDYNAMQICLSFSGPELTAPPACDVFDVDSDGDIDMKDTDAFMQVFTGTLSGVLVEAGTLRPVQSSPEGYYSGEPGTGGNNALNATAAQAGYTQDDLWYVWSVTEQPKGSGKVLLSNASKPATAYSVLSPLAAGSYLFDLTVTNLITFEFATDTAFLSVSELPECLEDADCDDVDFCTVDSCDFATGDCSNVAVDCPIGEFCDAGTGGCIQVCEQDADCDDGLFCNGLETCDSVSGSCTVGANPCLDGENCDEVTGCSPPGVIFFTLTLAQDAGPSFTGGTGNDVYDAPILFNPPSGTQAPTLQTGDSLNGAGGADLIRAQFNFTAATTVFPTMASIETVTLSDLGTAATTLNGTFITGSTEVNLLNSTNANVFTLSNWQNVVNLGIANTSVGVRIIYAAATTTGSSDTMGLNLWNANLSTGTGQSDVTIVAGAANGIETVNVSSEGAANKFRTLIQTTGNTMANFTVSGSQKLTITLALPTTVTSVDCSGASGGVDLTLATTLNVPFTGGAGDDRINYAGTYTTGDVVNGGAGDNTLALNSAGAIVTVAQTNVTNIHNIEVVNALNGALVLTHFSGANDAILDTTAAATAVTGGNSTITAPSGTNSLTINNDDTAHTLGHTTSGNSTTDVLNVNLQNADLGNTLTLTGAETVNLNSGNGSDGTAADGGANTATAITLAPTDPAPWFSTLNISGNVSLTLTGAISARTINATTFTGNLTMGAATVAPGGAVILGGAGNDLLWSATDNEIMSGGDGDDTLFIDSADDADILTGGGGADTFRFSAASLAGFLGTSSSTTGNTRITDFVAGTDKIALNDTGGNNTSIVLATPQTVSTAANPTAVYAGVTAIPVSQDGGMLSGVVVTVSTGNAAGTYLYVNDATAGVSNTADMLINITGISGTLAITDFRFD